VTIFWAAVGDFLPKALGFGLLALLIVLAAAVYTRWDTRRIAEQQARRLFNGNRKP
jgi:hypothetical protein